MKRKREREERKENEKETFLKRSRHEQYGVRNHQREKSPCEMIGSWNERSVQGEELL